MILALLLACHGGDSDSDAIVEPYTPPDVPGPYAVGTMERTVVSDDGTELTVQVWYPTESPGTTLYSYDELIEATAWVDPGPVACASPRPVVLFSHGNEGIRWQSLFITEQLAAHGYVVIAPDHTGNTFLDNSADRGALVIRRPHDIQASFDAGVAWAADSGDPLAGCIDPDAGYAMMGHSFGGYTTFANSGAPVDIAGIASICESRSSFFCGAQDYYEGDSADLADPRVWAAIPLAPVGTDAFTDPGLAAITVPTLVIGGKDDELTTWAYEVSPLFPPLTAEPRALAGIADTGHFTFTGLCDLLSTQNGCEDGRPIAEAQALIATLSIAWLDQARGRSEAAEWLPPESDLLEWTE